MKCRNTRRVREQSAKTSTRSSTTRRDRKLIKTDEVNSSLRCAFTDWTSCTMQEDLQEQEFLCWNNYVQLNGYITLLWILAFTRTQNRYFNPINAFKLNPSNYVQCNFINTWGIVKCNNPTIFARLQTVRDSLSCILQVAAASNIFWIRRRFLTLRHSSLKIVIKRCAKLTLILTASLLHVNMTQSPLVITKSPSTVHFSTRTVRVSDPYSSKLWIHDCTRTYGKYMNSIFVDIT